MRLSKRFEGFSSHPRVDGSHAILSPSNYHWLNDDEEKLLGRLRTLQAADRGTRLHKKAAGMIEDGIMVHPDSPIIEECGPAFMDYVNDAVVMGMVPEQTLFFSLNCYGTADAIRFEDYPETSELDGFLRIHDLKTGKTATSEKQLYIYAGIFCLEYEYNPYKIEGELRIYQGDDVRVFPLDRNYLTHVVGQIVMFDQLIEADYEREGKRGHRGRRL